MVLFRSACLQDVKPVVEKAHRVGAHVVLDVYQAAGTVPMDLASLGVDFAVGQEHHHAIVEAIEQRQGLGLLLPPLQLLLVRPRLRELEQRVLLSRRRRFLCRREDGKNGEQQEDHGSAPATDRLRQQRRRRRLQSLIAELRSLGGQGSMCC